MYNMYLEYVHRVSLSQKKGGVGECHLLLQLGHTVVEMKRQETSLLTQKRKSFVDFFLLSFTHGVVDVIQSIMLTLSSIFV